MFYKTDETLILGTIKKSNDGIHPIEGIFHFYPKQLTSLQYLDQTSIYIYFLFSFQKYFPSPMC